LRTLDTDIVIIGSGAAGATLAATLAERGRWRVALLERGGHFGREFFNQREWDMSQALYAERGRRTTDDGAIPVRGGECVGGGTTVNVALSFNPVERVWNGWRDRVGLEGFSFDASANDYGVLGLNMPSCLAEVRARLHVHPAEDREVNVNNALFAKGCSALGLTTRRFELNMRGCIGCGFCSAGCAYDAKQSALVTYVPDAIARGAVLIHHADVRTIEYTGARATAVVAVVAATRPGSRPNAVEPGGLRITAKLVIVSAGAIETPALLQRSGHPDPEQRIGRGLVLHPSLPFIGRAPFEVAGHRGIEGTVYSDHFAASDGFYFECLFGHPLYGASVLPGIGNEHFELMLSYRRLFGFGAMLVDESEDANCVRWDGVRERTSIVYRLSDTDAKRLRKAAGIGIQILFAAGAEAAWLASEERLGPLPTPHFRRASEAEHTRHLRFVPQQTTLTSAHAQATTRMGRDPRRSLLNSRGESHSVPNLIVCDSSAFPSSCGANPMLSIMCLARYQGRRIAAEAARYGL
jgi:choline dehydrogenase-like flavoprotein